MPLSYKRLLFQVDHFKTFSLNYISGLLFQQLYASLADLFAFFLGGGRFLEVEYLLLSIAFLMPSQYLFYINSDG